MNNQPRQILKQIIQQYGPDLDQDPRRTKSLLLDLAGPYKREINVLVLAAQMGVPAKLNSAGLQPMILLLPRLARGLENNWGAIVIVFGHRCLARRHTAVNRRC